VNNEESEAVKRMMSHLHFIYGMKAGLNQPGDVDLLNAQWSA
jgi:hypothetical protein